MIAGCVVQTAKCGPSEKKQQLSRRGGEKQKQAGLATCVCCAWATAPTPHDDRETEQFHKESFKKNLAMSHTWWEAFGRRRLWQFVYLIITQLAHHWTALTVSNNNKNKKQKTRRLIVKVLRFLVQTSVVLAAAWNSSSLFLCTF